MPSGGRAASAGASSSPQEMFFVVTRLSTVTCCFLGLCLKAFYIIDEMRSGSVAKISKKFRGGDF